MLSLSLKEMVKGRWREFCREPSALIFVILMPIMWMLILGLAINNSNDDKLRVGLVKFKSENKLEKILRQDSELFELNKDSKLNLLKPF